MKPISHNHTIEKGTSYSYEVIIVGDSGLPVDLTNAQVKSVMKKDHTSTEEILFTTSITEPTTGKVLLSLSADDTKNIKHGTYVYDVVYSLNTIVNKVLSGVVTIMPTTSYF